METEEKKFYWIKLRTDFFGDHSPMDFLLGQPNGSEYVCLYIKLCLATANTGGKLCDRFGEMLIPFDVEKIQRDMKFFSIDTVRVALSLYQQLGLIYEEKDGILAISNHAEIVGSETKWAKYKREERIGQTVGNRLDNVQQSIEIRDKEIRDKDNKEHVPQKRFVPPTLEEVRSYINEKNYNVSAESFISFYTSNGWKVGRNPMKDWKATVAQWNFREKEKSKSKPVPKQNSFNSFQQSETDYAAVIERKMREKYGQ